MDKKENFSVARVVAHTKDDIRGIKGSINEHLQNFDFKIKKDKERLEKITTQIVIFLYI